jgi:hypothetical protein
MSYLGNTPQNQAYAPQVDYFSGNSSTTAFTLSRPVASVAQMVVVVANVPQNPGSAYTVNGNTITFTSAPPSGTNNIWVEYTSLITQTIAPSQGTVNTSSLAGGTITTTADASINGLTVGKGGGNNFQNTVVGSGAVANGSNTGGLLQAFGYVALAGNTTGVHNDAFGAYALTSNTTGNYNSGIGTAALSGNTTGSSNVAVGKSALQSNTTASNNTAVGYQAGYSNTTGTTLTAFGFNAAYSNTTGANNIAIGANSLNSNSTGNSNTVMGYQVAYYNTTGSYNTAIGDNALKSNTTANYNTAVGYQAGYSNTTGTYNTFVGYAAGYSSNTSGNVSNTFVGQQSGYSVSTGANNTFLGAGAGYSVTTGSNNTIVGEYSGNQGGLNITTASNYIVLSDGAGNPRGIFDNNGNLLVGTTSSTAPNPGLSVYVAGAGNTQAIIGHSTSSGSGQAYVAFLYNGGTIGSITQNGTTAVAYNTSSDYRLKENIAPMTGALEKVAELKPVTYTWKTDGSKGQGFIAHELQAVVPDCVTGEKDAVDAEGNPVYQGIDTSFLVATLTAAIQELKAQNDSLTARIAKLEGVQ